MATSSAKGVRWNLNDLFSSYDDPRIEQTLDDCRTRAEALSRRYRGRIESTSGLTPEELLAGLRELEDIHEALSRVGCYSGLLYAADTSRPEYQDLEQKVEQRSTEIRNLLLFFELEWLKVEDDVAERLIRDPVLKLYGHYLKSLRRFRPHTLSEPEERILNERDNTGRNAFGRLFSEITSSLTFALEKDGEKEDLNLSQILALFHEPDRNLRQRAMDALYDVLSQHGQVLTFIYDTLIQDHQTMDRLRHGSSPPLSESHGPTPPFQRNRC